MRDFWTIINTIIKQEISNNRNIAIFPMGRVGIKAKYILEQRFGYNNGIFYDNEISLYNPNIKRISDVEKISNDYTIIICVSELELYKKLYNEVRKYNKEVKVRSCLEPMSVREQLCKETYFNQVKNLCRCKKAIDYNLVRIGGNTDGGYVMLDEFKSNYVAYSFGIGRDVSWDMKVADYGLKVHCYDHTIDRLPLDDERLQFHQIGIGACDYPKKRIMSINSILKQNGDEKRDNMILKIDVEGAEWDFIDSIDSCILEKFRQITMELHGLCEVLDSEKKIRVLKKIRKTHYPVWIHANNNMQIEFGNKTECPYLLEITYARKEAYLFEDIHYNCPIEIDRPNMDNMLDIELIGWGSMDDE